MNNATNTAYEAQFDKMPPASHEAECCFLASLMLEPEHIPEFSQAVPQESFFSADHEIIYEVIVSYYSNHKALNTVLIREELNRRGLLADVGGTAAIGEIICMVPSAAHVKHYAEIILEKWRLRRLIKQANRLLRAAYAPSREDQSVEMARDVAGKLTEIASGGTDRDVQLIGDVAQEVYRQIGASESPLMPFGIRDLDKATGGTGSGEMIVIGARPSMGKSILAKQLGIRSAQAGIPTLLVSLEEGVLKIGRNLLSSTSSVENNLIRSGQMDEAEWAAVAVGVQALCGIPLYITQKHRKVSDIYGVVHAMKAKYGIRRVIIDYLQRIPGLPGKDRFEKVTNASLFLSELSKEADVNLIVLSQLSRALSTRDDKRPTMTDLRESGQIEQDADGILLLHREDYYHSEDRKYSPTEIAELKIEKFRDGVRGGVIHMASRMKYQRFDDLSQNELSRILQAKGEPDECPYIPN